MVTQFRSHSLFAGTLALVLALQAVGGHSIARGETGNDEFSKLDVNEDGVLSGKEAATVRQFDADNDGEITKDEYIAGMAAEQKRLLSVDDDKLFSERDTNEDDWLSGSEVRGFEKYDADGDGEVSRKEFKLGRAEDRKKIGGPNKEQMARLAAERFRQLDLNEDGRLSGKEMVGFEKLDQDGDRRITEKEFVAGFTGEVSAGDPMTAFLDSIRAADAGVLLKAANPEFVKQIDRPVLQFILERVASALGAVDPESKSAMRPTQQPSADDPRTIYQGQLKFKKGTADAKLMVANGQIVGFSLESPALNDVSDRLHRAMAEDKDFAKSMADYYTPRCDGFVRLILAGEDEKAFGQYHPDVQRQLGREKVQGVFEFFRDHCGTYKGIELENLRVEFDANGKGLNYKLTHLVKGSKRDFTATTTFQFIGLSAHIVGLSVKAAEAIVLPTGEGKPNDKWAKVSNAKDGVAFEVPVTPQRIEEESGQRTIYSATSPDRQYIFTVFVESMTENLEPKAAAFFQAFGKQLAKDLNGELLDTDEANVGNHPGRIYFLKTNETTVFVERTVIVGLRIYRFQAVIYEQDKRKREQIVNRYLDSVKILTTDDDVPDPPVPAPKPPGKIERPAPPAPPALPKPPTP
jgi:Ca2+-binding EF-hand superfamily protein